MTPSTSTGGTAAPLHELDAARKAKRDEFLLSRIGAQEASTSLPWDVRQLTGLRNASGTKLQLNGAAYGNGIYLSPDGSMYADAGLEPSTS